MARGSTFNLHHSQHTWWWRQAAAKCLSFLVPLAAAPSNCTGHSYLSGAVFHQSAERRSSTGIGPPVAMRWPSCRSPHSHRPRSRHPSTGEKGSNPFADFAWEWGVAALAEEEAVDTGFASLALIGPPRWLTTVLRQREAPGNAQLGHVVTPVRAPGPCPAPVALHPFVGTAQQPHCAWWVQMSQLNPRILRFLCCPAVITRMQRDNKPFATRNQWPVPSPTRLFHAGRCAVRAVKTRAGRN